MCPVSYVAELASGPVVPWGKRVCSSDMTLRLLGLVSWGPPCAHMRLFVWKAI